MTFPLASSSGRGSVCVGTCPQQTSATKHNDTQYQSTLKDSFVLATVASDAPHIKKRSPVEVAFFVLIIGAFSQERPVIKPPVTDNFMLDKSHSPSKPLVSGCLPCG